MAPNLQKNHRVAMGVTGLDTILGGGLPRDRFYLVQGDPGVGKTTLAMQFLMEGRRVGAYRLAREIGRGGASASRGCT